MENQKNMTVAEIQLVYKSKVKVSDRPQISSSQDAFRVLQNHWNYAIIEFIEEFKVLLLNRANRVVGIIEVSVGGTTGTIADPKVIFAGAIKCAASGIILVHNHPSGNLKPSNADIDLTRKFREGGRLLDVQVLDHIILSRDGYYSFADEGMI